VLVQSIKQDLQVVEWFEARDAVQGRESVVLDRCDPASSIASDRPFVGAIGDARQATESIIRKVADSRIAPSITS